MTDETRPASQEFKNAWMKATKKELEIEALEDAFIYLDDLRESWATNMYGAGSWLSDEFSYTRKEASAVLVAWMKTFSDKPAYDRAKEILK